jgi:hypothetical protein
LSILLRLGDWRTIQCSPSRLKILRKRFSFCWETGFGFEGRFSNSFYMSMNMVPTFRKTEGWTMWTPIAEMTAPFERRRSHAVVLLLIPIAARELFSMFHIHNISVQDSIVCSFGSLDKVQNDSFCNAMLSEFSLCIAVISSNQSSSFRLTVPKLIDFIAKSESNLVYEIIWIGQAADDRVSLSKLYHFDKKFLFARPVRCLASFHLAFSQCTREYLFILEENWLIVNMSLPWFSFSIDLLVHAPESMYAFLLCMIPKDDPIYRTTVQSCLVP